MTPLERKQCRKLRSLVANQQGDAAGLEAKQAVVKGCKSAHKKFARLAKMNSLIDAGVPGVTKAKRKLADSWTKRQSNNTTGFYDPRKAKQ